MKFRHILIAFALTIFGKLFAFGKDVIFAFFFGVSNETDAYFIANMIPGLLWLAILATITSVFMPLYIKHQMQNTRSASDFAIQGIRLYAYFGVGLSIACFFAADTIVAITAPDASRTVRVLAVELTRIMTVAFAITGYVACQNALQQANKRFIAPLTVPVINNAVTIAAIFLAAYLSDIKIAVIGAVLGWVIQAPLQRWQTRKFYEFTPGWRVSKDVWTRLVLLSLPVSIAIFLDQINIFVGVNLASSFEAGAISQLNYANRLTLFIAGIFSWLVSYFFFPEIARNAGQGDDDANAFRLTQAIGLIIITTLPLAAVSLAMRNEVITVVYGRGAFSPQDIGQTAILFGFYGLGILFISVREMLNRVFFSYENTSTPLIIGGLSVAVNLAASIYLSTIMGLKGIALGATIGAGFFAIAQTIAILHWKPILFRPELAKILLASLSGALISYAATNEFTGIDGINSLFLKLIAGGIIGGIVFVIGLIITGLLLGLRVSNVLPLITPVRR